MNGIKAMHLINRKRGTQNQFTKAAKSGVKYQVSKITSAKLSAAGKGRKWSAERKESHSRSMKRAVKLHPESYTSSNRGRTKCFEKDGIKFQGNWEYLFYEWCKNKQIEIKRNVNWFPYIFEGKERSYNPDFYLPQYDCYVEIKGYETDRDRAKWNYFPNKLIVVKRFEIEKIQKNSYKIEL